MLWLCVTGVHLCHTESACGFSNSMKLGIRQLFWCSLGRVSRLRV